MDSNHDIVPTLRMMDGVYTGLAADEIERLRARVALLERRADTSLIPGAEPTHRCNVCGAYWRKWDIGGQTSWNLNSRGCGECCDNVAMGDQIEALASPAKVGGDARELPVLPHPTVFAGLTVTNEPVSHAYSAHQMVDYARAALSADGGEIEARAKTVHRRIDSLCDAANTPEADYFDASTNMMIATRELLTAIDHPHAMDVATIAAKRAKGDA